jgi:hypothetical protein
MNTPCASADTTPFRPTAVLGISFPVPVCSTGVPHHEEISPDRCSPSFDSFAARADELYFAAHLLKPGMRTLAF